MLALPEGYQRLFLDEGKPMAALLQAMLPEVSEEALVTYIQTLLAAFPTFELPASEADFGLRHLPSTANPGPSDLQPKIHHLVEPLSPQEERVLRLLVEGLSNQEMAQALIVSLNTVKTQVKSIYRKLQVHSRSEARYAARRLNLF